jgi:hypothetical protein
MAQFRRVKSGKLIFLLITISADQEQNITLLE